MTRQFQRLLKKTLETTLRTQWRMAGAWFGSALAPGLGAAGPGPQGAAAPGAFVSGRLARARGSRSWRLYIPADAPAGPRPLVVMLHGCHQDPDGLAQATGMNEAAQAQGWYVLYPAQSASANRHRCWNWFKPGHQGRGRGEPALLVAMVREVMAAHPVDPARVYIAGLSAGGAMAAILGALYPDVFAAVGVHSGLPHGAARDLRGALDAMRSGRATHAGRGDAPPPRTAAHLPVIVVHGDADTTVHPAHGQALFDAVAPGASPIETTTVAAGAARGYTRRLRRDGAGRVVAEHWLVHGGTHGWSGGQGRGDLRDPRGPDATAAMLAFFAQHRRPQRPGRA